MVHMPTIGVWDGREHGDISSASSWRLLVRFFSSWLSTYSEHELVWYTDTALYMFSFSKHDFEVFDMRNCPPRCWPIFIYLAIYSEESLCVVPISETPGTRTVLTCYPCPRIALTQVLYSPYDLPRETVFETVQSDSSWLVSFLEADYLWWLAWSTCGRCNFG